MACMMGTMTGIPLNPSLVLEWELVPLQSVPSVACLAAVLAQSTPTFELGQLPRVGALY